MRLLGSRKGTLRELASLEPQIRHLTDSLLRYAGALQLLPDNATKWLRFARLVEATRAARPAHPQRPATLAEIEALLTGPPIATEWVLANEDPFEGPFTAPVVFDDAEYLTVPGAVANAATVCQFLLQALDELPTEAAGVRELMQQDAARLLWISDTAARRGGLERWQEPRFEKDRGVHIPSVEELRRLKAAVCIDRSDLEIRFGGLEGFSDLCWPAKRIPWRRDRTRLTDDRALLFPLSLNSSSNGLIVPSPNQLALSVVHRVAARAAASGVHRHLMAAFERAVLAETERLCQQMKWVPLGSSLTLPPSSNVQDAVFAFDVDKIAHVVVFADDLDGYEAARPHAATDSASQMQRINKRMQHVRNAVRAVDPAGEVLHLMLMVPIGRPMHADFTELEGEGRSVLLLTIDEFRTIAYHERDDSLGLWRFARALDELPLPGYGTVNNAADVYALYLQSDRRPRRLGGPEARGILLPPGFGAPLTVRERRRSDAHAVHLPDGSRAVPVSREAVNESVRVYVPQREDLRHLRLVELALPCWVGAHGVGTQSQRFCAGVADAVSLHLWRIRDLVDTHLDKIAEGASCVVVDIVDPDGSVLSFADVDNAEDAPWFEIAVDHDHHRITVRLLPNAAVRLSQVADAAEEELIVEVARSLTSLAGRPSAVMDADLADVGVHEGPRFMHVGIGYVPGVHGGAQLPGCRLKYHVEIDAVVDEIDAIASGLGLEFGTVPAERRVEIIVEIVRTLNGRLRKKLRELDPDAIFELLVSEQERMQRDRTMLRVMAPNPFTDAGNGGDMPSAIEKYREIDQSALASRYLIELAVRCVRGGHRPMSLSRYDELLAISQQMIALGSIGDAYRLGLSDAELHFREPGCLRMGLSDPYCQAVGDRTDINARALGAQDLLAEWANFMASQDRVPAVDLSDESAVFEAEFGVPFIGFLEAVERLSELAAGNDVQVRTMPVPDLLRDLAATTELDQQQAKRMINMMSLRAAPADGEPDLFDPDFTPWRYARENSFLRRPVLIRECGDDGSVATWGSQAPWTATEALFEQMFSGRLAAKSRSMKQYISKQRNRISREFESEVADIFRRDPHNQVRVQVKSLGNTSLERQNGNKLGDIDVLVVNEHHKTLSIVEAKSFATSRNAREIKRDLDKLVSGENPAVAHHDERVKFVRDHWSTLHRQMQLAGRADDWQVEDMLVTSAPSIAADLLRRLGSEVGTTIISVEELQQTQTHINDRVSA